MLYCGGAYSPAVAHVHQISLSDGGVPKHAVTQATIDELGIVGDSHNDEVYHGGPDRALCLYSLEVIERLQGEGHPIEPGFAGENLTIAGLDWNGVKPGATLAIGDRVTIEITSYTAPCAKNAAWFNEGDFTRMLQSRHPGESRLYARVLTGGAVSTGDEVLLLE